MHAYRHNQMIYHVTGSGFVRKFRRCGCIVPAVVVMAAVAAAGVEAVVRSGEKSEEHSELKSPVRIFGSSWLSKQSIHIVVDFHAIP